MVVLIFAVGYRMRALLLFLLFVSASPALAGIASVGYVSEHDKNVVHKTGDEEIQGRKTFQSAPMIPTAKLPELAQ